MTFGSMMGVLLTLGFVLALLGVALKLLRRFAPTSSTGATLRMEIVQRLARGEAKSDGQRRIQVAAVACLPSLLLRVEQQRSHQTLLRDSSAAKTEPETLLRAASGGSSLTPLPERGADAALA